MRLELLRRTEEGKEENRQTSCHDAASPYSSASPLTFSPTLRIPHANRWPSRPDACAQGSISFEELKTSEF